MKITDDEGSKKATCPRCGQVSVVAGTRPGKRGRSGVLTAADEQTVLLSLAPVPAPRGPDTAPAPGVATGSVPPLHELPTRYEGPEVERGLTDFLSPGVLPGEIGRLGPYRILDVVGAGGMGVVFKAEDPRLRRLVALKAMLPALAANPTARERFLREAQAAAAIQHDHVVAVYQVDEANNVPYLAMPFLRGESLEARLRQAGGPLPLAEVLRIAAQIGEGLAAVHELGLIHRDIKPANIFLETQPGEPAGGGRVKILDFGLARAASGDAQLTQEGHIVGTAAYMAPEQAGRQTLDARADLFSLGCVLYLMATGSLPFEGADALSTLFAVATADPVPPHTRNPALPGAVSELILSLLEKKPADRPGSARAVVAALRRLARA